MNMRRKTTFAIAMIACAATAAIAQQRPSTTTRPAAGASTLPADYYSVVTDKNIFVRERRKPVVATTRTPSTRPAPTLESVLVLRGVVLEDSSFRAYFENTAANELIRVAAGDVLAKGHVASISIDAVEFESANGMVWVKVGDNLVGSRVATAGSSTSSDGSGASASGSSASQPAAGALMSIEERMRQRRAPRDGNRR